MLPASCLLGPCFSRATYRVGRSVLASSCGPLAWYVPSNALPYTCVLNPLRVRADRGALPGV